MTVNSPIRFNPADVPPVSLPQTLLQTRGTSNDARIRNATGMAEALKIIVARDGWKGLRRGMSARVVTFAPSTAISWASYEFFSESTLAARGLDSAI